MLRSFLISYIEWGKECLQRFNGMWALAIYDSLSKEIFLSRDRFGVKPLFYSYNEEGFIFSSEMKSLIPLIGKKSINKNLIRNRLLINKYEATEQCLINEIYRFPAGSYAIISDGKVLPKKFWKTLDNLVEVPKSYNEQCELFRELFFDSCRLRMRSDVKIGTALSGGLDSSATICSTVYLINQSNEFKGANVGSVVARMENTMLDETYYADIVADYLGIKNIYADIDPNEGLKKLPDMLFGFEEVYYTSPIPMVQTYETLRENGILVTLDGHGADELWGGYIEDIMYSCLDTRIFGSDWKDIMTTYEDMDVLNAQKQNEVYKYIKFLAKNAVKILLGVNNDKKYDPTDKNLKKMGHFDRTLYNDFHNTILPTLLRNYDRYSMLNGVEIRMPFMDYRLVKYAFSLGWKSKFNGNASKSIIRDSLGDIMPKEIINRKSKIGFNTPIVEWMKGPWRDFVQDTIESTEFCNSDLVNPRIVRRMVANVINNDSATYKEAERAWSKLMPFLWKKYFYERAIKI